MSGVVDSSGEFFYIYLNLNPCTDRSELLMMLLLRMQDLHCALNFRPPTLTTAISVAQAIDPFTSNTLSTTIVIGSVNRHCIPLRTSSYSTSMSFMVHLYHNCFRAIPL